MEDEYANSLFRDGDPPFRRFHNEWWMTFLFETDTESLFELLGPGPQNLRLLMSEPFDVSSSPNSPATDLPFDGLTQAFRRADSKWLQITSARGATSLWSKLKKISEVLQTRVFLSADAESAYSYELYDAGSLVEKYQRSHDDIYQYIPDHARDQSDQVRDDGKEILNTTRDVSFDASLGAQPDLESSLYDQYDLDPLPPVDEDLPDDTVEAFWLHFDH